MLSRSNNRTILKSNSILEWLLFCMCLNFRSTPMHTFGSIKDTQNWVCEIQILFFSRMNNGSEKHSLDDPEHTHICMYGGKIFRSTSVHCIHSIDINENFEYWLRAFMEIPMCEMPYNICVQGEHENKLAVIRAHPYRGTMEHWRLLSFVISIFLLYRTNNWLSFWCDWIFFFFFHSFFVWSLFKPFYWFQFDIR